MEILAVNSKNSQSFDDLEKILLKRHFFTKKSGFRGVRYLTLHLSECFEVFEIAKCATYNKSRKIGNESGEKCPFRKLPPSISGKMNIFFHLAKILLSSRVFGVRSSYFQIFLFGCGNVQKCNLSYTF